jgi:hypothetical protein
LKQQTALRLANEQRKNQSAPSEELNDRQPTAYPALAQFGSPAYNSFCSPFSPRHIAQQQQTYRSY